MTFTAPDWRNEFEYPSHKENSSLSFWAWQFLRRNKQYQADWQSYVESLREMVKRKAELAPFVEIVCDASLSADERIKQLSQVKRPGLEDCEFWHAPNIQESQSIIAYARRTGKAEPKERALAHKWGLEKLTNPARIDVGPREGFQTAGGPTFVGDAESYCNDDNYIITALDLRKPVASLREEFEFLLAIRDERIKSKAVVPYKGRPDRSLHLFPAYLRVIDATDADISVREVASVLLPHQDSDGACKVVRNWCKAAEKIRTETYRVLPAHSVIKSKKK